MRCSRRSSPIASSTPRPASSAACRSISTRTAPRRAMARHSRARSVTRWVTDRSRRHRGCPDMAWSALRVLLLTGLALAVGLAGAAAAVRVPSCAQFIDFGSRWVGIDEEAAARVLATPLYELSNADIDLITKGLQTCLDAASSPQNK